MKVTATIRLDNDSSPTTVEGVGGTYEAAKAAAYSQVPVGQQVIILRADRS